MTLYLIEYRQDPELHNVPTYTEGHIWVEAETVDQALNQVANTNTDAWLVQTDEQGRIQQLLAGILEQVNELEDIALTRAEELRASLRRIIP